MRKSSLMETNDRIQSFFLGQIFNLFLFKVPFFPAGVNVEVWYRRRGRSGGFLSRRGSRRSSRRHSDPEPEPRRDKSASFIKPNQTDVRWALQTIQMFRLVTQELTRKMEFSTAKPNFSSSIFTCSFISSPDEEGQQLKVLPGFSLSFMGSCVQRNHSRTFLGHVLQQNASGPL